MDLNFEQMLAQHNQEFKEAEVYSDWMPPDAEYVVSLIKLDQGTTSKDGQTSVWWKLTGRIEDVQDAKLNGKEFSVGFYSSKAFGILKGAVKTLAGDLVNDLAEAHAVLEASIGKIIKAKVATKTAKNGNEYTNCYIQEVIETTTASAGEETPVITQADVGQVPADLIAGAVPPAAEGGDNTAPVQQAPVELLAGQGAPVVNTTPPVV